jgi:hypothetical protein
MLALDPLRLDRTLSRFAALRLRFLDALRAGTAPEHSFELLPPGFDDELLASLTGSEERDPLARPLRAWLGFLLLEHDTLESRRRVAAALRHERHRLDEPERAELSLAEMRRAALVDAPLRAGWLRAYETRAGALQHARLAYWERRTERAGRLGVTLLRDAEMIHQLVANTLSQTAEAYADLGIRTLSAYIEGGLAHDAPGLYPKRLSPRGLGELFREGNWLGGLEPSAPELPEMLAPASLSRGLWRFGETLHDAATNRRKDRPFVVANDVRGLRRAEFGALFALLPLSSAFAVRRLELSRSRLSDYSRAVRRMLLLALRSAAVRAELRLAEPEGAERYRRSFTEFLPDALNFELDPKVAGALFVDEAASERLWAVLSALAKNQALTEEYDDDWFRNPRAVEALRAELEEPPYLEFDEARALAGLTFFVKSHV